MKRWMALFLLGIVVACSGEEQKEEKDSENETTVSSQEQEEIVYFANTEADITIEGMSCEINCVSSVKKALRKVDGITSVEIDFDAERNGDYCKVQYDNAALNIQSIQTIIESVNNGEYKVTESNEKELEETSSKKSTAFNFSGSSKSNNVNTSTNTGSSFSIPSILDFVVALF